MEPFGLLNLLKTLLPSTQDGESSPPPDLEENAPPPTPTQEKENACASFLAAHEKRAGRKK
nr:hypothetical protein [Clostridia bacterium]